MKKLFLLFALVALCSCGPATINNKTEQGILDHFDKVIHFTYKGHKYIKFEETYGNASVGGVVHDPDCWCSKNKDKNEHRTVN